ncbi:MAG TPA: thioredoxin [Abditibacteriaceae bacterium]|nr:thioredoxin [Abditibacteriaceae bacterium]
MSENAAQLAHVGNDDFETEVVASDLPVVVDFYAPWCAPCKMLAPVLEKVAVRYEGRVKVVKCDSDRDVQISESYGVGKIPNLMFFKDGEVVNQYVGYANEAQLSQMFDALLDA